MLNPLENSFHLPNYLLRILNDYLIDSSLLNITLESQREMQTTSGVAQMIISDFNKDTNLTKKKMPNLCPKAIGEMTIIELKPTAKYFGSTLDLKVSFSHQINT